MSTTLEQAWRSASTTWRSDELRAQTPAQLLRARVDRQTRRMRWIVAIEVVITVIVLQVAVAAIVKSGQTGAGVVRLSAMVVLYTAGVWTFALWNRRGTWSPYGEATADFVALLRLRAQRRMKAAHFCIAVVTIAGLLVSRQIEAAWRGAAMTVWDRAIWIAFGAYTVAIVVWGLWYLKRARRELQSLAALEQELDLH